MNRLCARVYLSRVSLHHLPFIFHSVSRRHGSTGRPFYTHWICVRNYNLINYASVMVENSVGKYLNIEQDLR